MSAPLQAYDLDRLVRNPDYWELDIFAGLEAAPERRRFSLAAQDVIRAIHAIPRLHIDRTLNHVEVYVGRAGATSRHVFNRWKEHHEGKKHLHGLVVLRCDTDDVAKWEGAAVKVLRRLGEHGKLCVKNASASGQGAVPNEPTSCIYITWRTTSEGSLEPCDRRTLEAVASDVARDTEIRRDQVLQALDPLTRPQRDFAAVEWHYHHNYDDD